MLQTASILRCGIDMKAQAYDSHCNLVLGEVEETIYVVEEDEDEQETVKVCKPKCHF